MQKDKSGKVPNKKLPSSLGTHYPPGTTMCDNTQSVADQGSLPEFYQDFVTWT